MTKKQFLRAAKALAKSCNIVGRLNHVRNLGVPLNKWEWDRCAVGELMHEVGIKDSEMSGGSVPNDDQSNTLFDELGIGAVEWHALMQANDGVKPDSALGDTPEVVCQRRKKVIGVLKTFVKEEKPNDCVSETQAAE